MTIQVYARDTVGTIHQWEVDNLREFDNLASDMALGRALRYVNEEGYLIALNSAHIVLLSAQEVEESPSISAEEQSGQQAK